MRMLHSGNIIDYYASHDGGPLISEKQACHSCLPFYWPLKRLLYVSFLAPIVKVRLYLIDRRPVGLLSDCSVIIPQVYTIVKIFFAIF